MIAQFECENSIQNYSLSPTFNSRHNIQLLHPVYHNNGRSKSRKVVFDFPGTPLSSDTSFLCRKRKLTDKTLPNAVLQHPDFAADSKMYQDLLEMERKLDWTMTRKKVEVQDALVRTPTVRIYVWRHSSSTHTPSDYSDSTNIFEPHCHGSSLAGWRDCPCRKWRGGCEF